MVREKEQRVNILSLSVPALIEMVPLVRGYVSDILSAKGFSDKSSYRTGLIVDELCSNAVKFGSSVMDAQIKIRLSFSDSQIDLTVTDQGGSAEHRQKLQQVVCTQSDEGLLESGLQLLGLRIVKTLADTVEVTTSAQCVTQVRITRRRED